MEPDFGLEVFIVIVRGNRSNFFLL